jgi:hypothetical protein
MSAGFERFRAVAVASAMAAVLLLTGASSASALTIPDVVGGVETAVSGAVSTATTAGCKLTGNSTLCTLTIASYSVQTDYVAPGGHHVVKTTGAVLDVPTLVDVNGDGIPDIAVSINAVNTSNVKLQINRLPTSPTAVPLPVQVEAVINDPSTQTRKINVGYDARTSNAPAKWQAQAAIAIGTAISVTGQITTSGAPSSLTAIGGMFTEMVPGQRMNPQQARITYTPVPSTANIAFSLSKAAQTGTVSTDQPTKADLDLLLVDGLDSTHVTGTLDQLHAPVSVLLDKVDGAGHETDGTTGNSHVHLDTQGDVAHAAVGVESTKSSVVVTRVRLALAQIPKAIDFTQTATGALLDTSAPIGLVSGGVASGDVTHPVPAAAPVELADPEYVHQDDTAGVGSTTFRVAGLQHVAFDASGPDTDRKITIGARLASAAMHVLLTSDKTSPATIYDVLVDKVPHSLSLAISPSEQKIASFCGSSSDDPDPCSTAAQGSGAGIDKITINKAFNPSGLFGKATTLSGFVLGIPPLLGLSVSSHSPSGPSDPNQDTSVAINADHRIGQVTMFATATGVTPPAVPADDGIVYHDQPFALAAQIHGFISAAFDTQPQLSVILYADGGHNFTYDLAFPSTKAGDPDVTYSGQITGRPALTVFSFSAPKGQPTVLHILGVDKFGNPAVTPEATLHAYNPEGIFGDAKHLDGDVTGIPANEHVTITTHSPSPQDQNTMVHLDADHPLGEAKVQAWGDGTAPAVPSTDGVTYVGAPFQIAAHVHGFTSAHLDTQPKLDVALQAAPGDFSYSVALPSTIDGSPSTETFSGVILGRPAHTEFTFSSAQGQPTVVHLDGADGNGNPVTTPEILLNATQIQSLTTDTIHNVHVELKDIPATVDLTTSSLNHVFNLAASTYNNTPIGVVDVNLDNDRNPADPVKTVPDAGGGVIYYSSSDLFLVHARVLQLKNVSVTSQPQNVDATIDVAVPQPFRIYMNTGMGDPPSTCPGDHNAQHVEYHDVMINDLQPGTHFKYTGTNRPDPGGDPCKATSGRLIDYSADGNAGTITYDTNVGDMSHLHAVVGQDASSGLQVPRHLSICQASNDYCFQQLHYDFECYDGLIHKDYCSSPSADATVFLDSHGERTHAHVDFCGLNKPGTPNFFDVCTKGQNGTAQKGTFVDLTFNHIDLGFHYDTGFGFLETNTKFGGIDRGVTGYLRNINHDSVAEYINFNFGYNAQHPEGSTWEQHYERIVLAVLYHELGTAECVNAANGPSFDITKDTYFHVILKTAGNDENWLGDNLTPGFC